MVQRKPCRALLAAGPTVESRKMRDQDLITPGALCRWGPSLPPEDYRLRRYLSAAEAARWLGITVRELHALVKGGRLEPAISASGQQRFTLDGLRTRRNQISSNKPSINIPGPLNLTDAPGPPHSPNITGPLRLSVNGTSQTVHFSDSRKMNELDDDSVHLMVTSPPYFDTKMYSREPIKDDLGNIHELDGWFEEISKSWAEVLRVLSPGRKAFINIMNLPVREHKSFHSLNLVGRTIDVCEKLGFIFRRDIVWHKTNGVRAHFGTYPYPGGILLNNMHEFILEFQKPEKKGFDKYGHLTREQKEASRIDKDFWLSLKNSDVWVMKPEKSGDRRVHVAPFPYELPYRLIKAYSYVSETVLDPFCGSGIALRAAADLGRNGVGYEIMPDFCQTIEGVLAETGEPVHRLPNPEKIS
jgi:DNA modification methylase